MQHSCIRLYYETFPKELIADKGAFYLADAVKMASGVIPASYYNQYTIRGISQNDEGQIINGMRTRQHYFLQPLTSNIERVEMIKGPSSATFSSVDPGGSINLVTKKPLSIDRKEVSLSVGSFSTFRGSLDFTGPLNELLQNFSISVDETIKMLLFILFHFVYLIFFCIIAVLVSASSKTSKKALISLIGIWLIFTIILPRTTQAIGAYIFEAPSKIQFQSDIEKDILKQGDSHNPNDLHYKAIKDSLLSVYKVDSVQKLPFNYSGFIMTEGEKISSRIYNQHLEKLLEMYKKQNSFSKTVSFLNPYIAIKNLSMGLSNTDYDSYIDFQKQAEDYRYNMAQKINGLQVKYISNKKPGPNDKPLTINKEHWADVAEFHYEPKGILDVLKSEIVSVISIILRIIMLFIWIRIAAKNLKAI